MDRDDLGQANDVVTMFDGQTKIMKQNREIMTVRGIVAGEYIVNAHFYSAKASPYKITPMDVHITVLKIKLQVSIVLIPYTRSTSIVIECPENHSVISNIFI